MSFASLIRNIALLSTLLVVPVLSYSADFKELWKEKGGTVKEPAKSSTNSLQGAGPNESGQNEKGKSAISNQPEQVDPQEPAKPSSPITESAIEEEKKDRPQRREYNLESKPGISKRAEALPPMPSRMSYKPLSASDVYRKVESSIFIILVSSSLRSTDSKLAQGSAVAISARHLITNCHVIGNSPYIAALQGERMLPVYVVLRKEDCDLCVLSIQKPSLTPIKGIRKFNDLMVGEEVYSVGAPIGLEKTIGKGIISALRGNRYIQTSAPISPGSSGGGLFDSRGNLIGITTLGSFEGTQNLNFAIAAEQCWE